MSTHETLQEQCEEYIHERTGKYEYRAIRYRAAIDEMVLCGLNDTNTVTDVGAGWTELDYTLRAEYNWRGRYIPIDGAFDGTDLETWCPQHDANFFVALELLEHLHDPWRLVEAMKAAVVDGGAIVVSVPNPDVVDVFEMDATHLTAIDTTMLESWGFEVTPSTFYGGHYSHGAPNDALLGVWHKNQHSVQSQ